MKTISAPKRIYDICPSCNPTSYTKTTCTFIKQVDDIDNEYLYLCDNCNSKLWVDEDWARRNEVEAND